MKRNANLILYYDSMYSCILGYYWKLFNDCVFVTCEYICGICVVMNMFRQELCHCVSLSPYFFETGSFTKSHFTFFSLFLSRWLDWQIPGILVPPLPYSLVFQRYTFFVCSFVFLFLILG